jgi:Fic family protein
LPEIAVCQSTTLSQAHRRRGQARSYTQYLSEEFAMSDQIDNDEEEFAGSTLIQAIENQIESDNPPAAKATFNKLTLVGYERDDILEMMAHVLAFEIDDMLEADRPFDNEWYEKALRALPELPPGVKLEDAE